ncbi:MAG: M24 family metallopeptidase, partial [Bacteroidales bacterium]|nr:M24 family metallopeptidase [Bacteroidales bacterium]
ALHYITNNAQCKDGDMLLMDFGAEYANYAADLSRTIPVNGKFTSRQKELYNTTLKVFQMAKKVLKPGTTINAINKHVQRLWEDEHIRLGLYTKSDAAKSDEPLFKQYYPHGVSHFLGLDVHDVGSKDMVLQPGMILTCEPGIYIRKEKIGIRIENDVLITEDGNIDLMEDIPIEIEELEDIMNS